VNDKNIVQYQGHKVTPESREYTFSVREPSGTERQFCLAIQHTAFAAHRVRFQDAAEICSIRLQHELTATPEMQAAKLGVTDADLEAYRLAHAPKKHVGTAIRKPAPAFK